MNRRVLLPSAAMIRRATFLVPCVAFLACSSASTNKDDPFLDGNGDGGTGGDATSQDDGGALSDGDPGQEFALPDVVTPPCVGLQCQQKVCEGGGKTTVSGTVWDPAARVQLYNVIVYVPNAPLEPLPKGASCDRCGAVASGSPIVTALTDAKGNFTLENVPVGTNIPLVMQVGKWRRKIIIPEVKECVDNALTDKQVTRLPRSRKDGEDANIPDIAIATGSADELECFLREVGIDDSEFTGGTGIGAIHLYQASGGSTKAGVTAAQPFWSNVDNLKKYDIVILSCEGGEHSENKPQEALDAMKAYADLGGRIFASHFHYYWFKYGPADFKSTATWSSGTTASTYAIDQTHPKGQAFADWLVNVGASTTKGSIALSAVKSDVTTINNATSTRWVYKSASPESVKYLSFNTPIAAKPEEQCGRAVFSDIHISNTTGGGTFPTSCDTSGGFTAQEKALEFLLFDLSACVQPPGDPPRPPPPQ